MKTNERKSRSWSKACSLDISLSGIAGSNPAGVWMSVSCECCVLSARDFYDRPSSLSGDSY